MHACRLVLHIIPIVLSANQGSCKYYFLKSFGMTRLGEMNPKTTDCEADALTTTPSDPVLMILTKKE